LLGKDNSGFGYSIGDKVEFFSDQSIWNLHKGTKKVPRLFTIYLLRHCNVLYNVK
jgi:hypothetical protein